MISRGEFMLRYELKYLNSKKPINMITYGKSKSDNVNRMITITNDIHSVTCIKWDL